MHIKKHLSFGSLRKMISGCLQSISEHRQREKTRHSIHDVFMSGFAMMYFQDPSLLQFQKRLEEGIHNNNLTAKRQSQEEKLVLVNFLKNGNLRSTRGKELLFDRVAYVSKM